MDRWERRRHGFACRPRSLGSSRRPSLWVRPPIGPLDLHPCTLSTVPAWRVRCGTCHPSWSLAGRFLHRIASLGLASLVSRLLLTAEHGDNKHGGQGGKSCFKTSRSGGLLSSRRRCSISLHAPRRARPWNIPEWLLLPDSLQCRRPPGNERTSLSTSLH